MTNQEIINDGLEKAGSLGREIAGPFEAIGICDYVGGSSLHKRGPFETLAEAVDAAQQIAASSGLLCVLVQDRKGLVWAL